MAGDIKHWLEDLDLVKYADVFIENEVGLRDLPYITDDELRELGLPLGPRKRIMGAINALVEIATPASKEVVVDEDVAASQAERRQLTVMFCDLVGSTELSQRLDPEDLRNVMRGYQDTVASCIARYDGHLAKFLGDGVLAYFGWPQAYEDQAERAGRAGLDAVAAVRNLEFEGADELEARVGIATGQVVVGDLIGQATADIEAVSGVTPNLAARLQGVADPGQVVIGATTRRLVGQAFELVELEPQRLKGFSEAVHVWRIVGERAAEGRFEAAHTGTLARLIGRRHELGLLQERWELAKSGEGQVILLSGEAGIGKSRMMRALDEQIADEHPIRLRYQCASHRTNSAYFPIIQRLERTAGFSFEDTPEIKLDKLEEFLKRSAGDLDEGAPLFAALLSVPSDDRYGPLDLTPQELRNRTNAALVSLVLALSRQRPVLFAFEDAHWIDPTTETLIGEMMAGIGDAAVLMLISHRPNYVPPWTGHTNLTSVALNRLSREQSAEIVGTVAGEALASAVIDDIVARADGVPLYVEELAKFIVEVSTSADDRVVKAQIPETLQASLVARLDRLGEAKEVAHIGSVIGRVFRHELIAAVADRSDDELNGALDRIVDSELVFRRGDPPDAIYTFKHALVRDAAYQSLLKSTRQQYHLRIAGALDQHFPAVGENEPEVAAHHCTEAGLTSEAATLWERAGRRALEFSAYREAIDHFEQALAGVRALPPDSNRDGRELVLQLVLGAAWIAAKAYSADEVRGAYGRAVELSHRVGTAEQRFAAIRGLWNNHLMRVELNDAKELAVRLRYAAEESGAAGHRLVAERAAGSGLMALGEHVAANDCFRRGIDLYDPEDHRHYVRQYGEDPGLWCYAYAGWTGDWLGHRDRAREYIHRAVELAGAFATPHTLAIALTNAALAYVFRREVEATLTVTEEAMQIANELGIVQFQAWTSIHRGWALAHRGEVSAGLAEIEGGLATWRAIGGLNNRTHFLNLLADVCRLAGRPEAGMKALDEAEEIAASVDLHAHDAEMKRQRGQLYLTLGRRAEAEASWLRAIETAQSQQTKTLELRATTSLAALWRDQGKTGEACALLTPVYGWFTEGFDTADLRDAKALLDELN